MKHFISIFFSALIFFITLSAHALVTEIGINYGYQKKTFNQKNYYQSDSKAATVSIYFLEKFALELEPLKMKLDFQTQVYNNAQNNLSKAQSDLLQAKYDYILKLKVLDFYLGKPLSF